MKTRNIFWGLSLILASVIIILGATGIVSPISTFAGDISVVTAIVCAMLFSYAITRIIKGDICGIILPATFIFMLLEKNIAVACGYDSENIISNWLLIICALMLRLGFSLIFKGTGKRNRNRLSSSVIYVDLRDGGQKEFTNRLGDLTVRFENPEAMTDDMTVYVHNSLGDTVLEIPSEVHYVCKMSNMLGDISSERNRASTSAPTVTIKGSNKLGDVRIRLV